MRKPRELTVGEEREVARLIACGRSAAWARQRVAENVYRRRDAVPAAIKAVSEEGCSLPVLHTDQSSEEVRPFHEHTMERNDAKRHIAER